MVYYLNAGVDSISVSIVGCLSRLCTSVDPTSPVCIINFDFV